ncbi:MAG: hypothetical protein LBD94_02060 [Rickettsiales bacterium]|jgi:hypothetical protein|nr:hypothetical protein [Rickettsiales bacterium]
MHAKYASLHVAYPPPVAIVDFTVRFADEVARAATARDVSTAAFLTFGVVAARAAVTDFDVAARETVALLTALRPMLAVCRVPDVLAGAETTADDEARDVCVVEATAAARVRASSRVAANAACAHKSPTKIG